LVIEHEVYLDLIPSESLPSQGVVQNIYRISGSRMHLLLQEQPTGGQRVHIQWRASSASTLSLSLHSHPSVFSILNSVSVHTIAHQNEATPTYFSALECSDEHWCPRTRSMVQRATLQQEPL